MHGVHGINLYMLLPQNTSSSVLTLQLFMYIGRNGWKMAAEMVHTGMHLFFQV